MEATVTTATQDDGTKGTQTTTADATTTTKATTQGTTQATTSTTTADGFKWGDGWRDALAKGDEKVRARLERFATPDDIWKMNTELEKKMSSGALKTARPKDDNPEALTAWRKENGIPEKPDGYELKFDNGLVIGEEDKPVIDAFLAVAHKNDLPPSAVKDAVAWYYETAEKQTDARAEQDLKLAREAADALRTTFGTDYRPNMNAMQSFLDLAPAGLKDKLLHGRLADGTPVGSSPEAIQWLVSLARQINPVGTVVPAGTVNPGQHLEAEIAKYESMLGNRNSEYWKGDKAQWHQNRYLELTAAKQQMATRK